MRAVQSDITDVVNAVMQGMAPLALAVLYGHVDVTGELLGAGASILAPLSELCVCRVTAQFALRKERFDALPAEATVLDLLLRLGLARASTLADMTRQFPNELGTLGGHGYYAMELVKSSLPIVPSTELSTRGVWAALLHAGGRLVEDPRRGRTKDELSTADWLELAITQITAAIHARQNNKTATSATDGTGRAAASDDFADDEDVKLIEEESEDEGAAIEKRTAEDHLSGETLPWHLLVQPGGVWDPLGAAAFCPAANKTLMTRIINGWLTGRQNTGDTEDEKHFVLAPPGGVSAFFWAKVLGEPLLEGTLQKHGFVPSDTEVSAVTRIQELKVNFDKSLEEAMAAEELARKTVEAKAAEESIHATEEPVDVKAQKTAEADHMAAVEDLRSKESFRARQALSRTILEVEEHHRDLGIFVDLVKPRHEILRDTFIKLLRGSTANQVPPAPPATASGGEVGEAPRVEPVVPLPLPLPLDWNGFMEELTGGNPTIRAICTRTRLGALVDAAKSSGNVEPWKVFCLRLGLTLCSMPVEGGARLVLRQLFLTALEALPTATQVVFGLASSKTGYLAAAASEKFEPGTAVEIPGFSFFTADPGLILGLELEPGEVIVKLQTNALRRVSDYSECPDHCECVVVAHEGATTSAEIKTAWKGITLQRLLQGTSAVAGADMHSQLLTRLPVQIDASPEARWAETWLVEITQTVPH
eukprot:NODE_319_length_3171_cov_7.025953.p1 GENE.NODE_319_length_3171_cov_7.025953~~NODE_319_length_3171_cov_7.025953.p1  ORF type:complete len:706 (-),score=205.94 NODE_319_length_3171_cov_7.025953:301-2418(-)